jgi:hypothetical protein
MNSNLYNPLSNESVRLLKLISSSHEVGLHIESPNNFFDTETFNKEADRQIENLESAIERKIESISWHRPHQLDLGGEERVKGLINFYSATLFTQFRYFSDSANGWTVERENDFKVTLESSAQVQLLLHPEWWEATLIGKKAFKKAIESQLKIQLKEITDENRVFQKGLKLLCVKSK